MYHTAIADVLTDVEVQSDLFHKLLSRKVFISGQVSFNEKACPNKAAL